MSAILIIISLIFLILSIVTPEGSTISLISTVIWIIAGIWAWGNISENAAQARYEKERKEAIREEERKRRREVDIIKQAIRESKEEF